MLGAWGEAGGHCSAVPAGGMEFSGRTFKLPMHLQIWREGVSSEGQTGISPSGLFMPPKALVALLGDDT